MQQEFNYPKSTAAIDASIEKGDVDAGIETLKQHFSEEELENMSAKDFYNNYKKFA